MAVAGNAEHWVSKGTKLDAGSLVIIDSMLKTSMVGMIGIGFVILALIIFPFRKGEKWASWVIPGISLILAMPLYTVGLFFIPWVPFGKSLILLFGIIIVAFILAHGQDENITA